MSDNNDSKKFSMLTFLIGGLIGVAAGLLYAPKSGRETREDLGQLKNKVVDKAGEVIDSARESGSKLYDKGYERFADLKDRFNEKFEDAKNTFKSFKEEGNDSQDNK
jgi:gas vesicle protein